MIFVPIALGVTALTGLGLWLTKPKLIAPGEPGSALSKQEGDQVAQELSAHPDLRDKVYLLIQEGQDPDAMDAFATELEGDGFVYTPGLLHKRASELRAAHAQGVQDRPAQTAPSKQAHVPTPILKPIAIAPGVTQMPGTAFYTKTIAQKGPGDTVTTLPSSAAFGKMNIRQGPSTSTPIIGHYSHPTTATILQRDAAPPDNSAPGGWIYLDFGNGLQGYTPQNNWG